MKKFRLHPAVVILAVFAVLCGRAKILLSAVFALFIHECGHALCARKLGFVPDDLFITPFGATMSFDCCLSGKDEFSVSLRGPLYNIFSCIAVAALWWFFPATYLFTREFFDASFSLALFNLLPVVPFDGGRIILSLVKNKLRFLRVSRVFGFVFGGIFLVAGIASAVFGRGFTLLAAGITILWSNIFEAPKERYRVIFSMAISNMPDARRT